MITGAITGVRIDTRVMDELVEKLDKKASVILGMMAFKVEQLAKLRALRDESRPPLDLSQPTTGALRNSIYTWKYSDLLYIVGVGVEYAIYHEPKEYTDYGVYYELGTSRLPARPFLSPSVEKMRKEFEEKWGELFE
jgi:HK97 gp10 family phage protein